METFRKLLIYVIVIALAVVLGPFAARAAFPSWGFDRDLKSGRVAWRPISGVLVERHLAANLWEQFIVDWVGPGSIQVIQYAASPEGGGRERLGTEEMRVTIDIARLYTLASSDDAFPVVVAQKYQDTIAQNYGDAGGKALDTPYGSLFFAPTAVIEISRGGRFGLRKLQPGDLLQLDGTRWSYAGKGPIPSGGPSRSGAGSFAILRGIRTAQPLPLDARIDAISTAMLIPTMPSDESGGGGLVAERDPLAGTTASIAAMLKASNWTFPLSREQDLVELLTHEQREALRVPNTVAAGWGYSHDPDAIASPRAAWYLRCLDETEIWVPYQSPL